MSSSVTAPLLSTHKVRICLRNINPWKAAGPDGVMSRVLKDCAGELAEVFTTIYNILLSSAWVPACFRGDTIVAVPKLSRIICLNDYRPVVLKLLPAKCLERLVIKHIKNAIPPTLDQYQFAYRENRSIEDAISIAIYTLLQHPEHKNTYARLLFVDFSLAFNTIRPNKFTAKLYSLGLNTSLCN